MYKIILIFHIILGAIALISGAWAIFSRKGSKRHMTAGKVYTLSMYSIGTTALFLTLMKFNPFLLAIGIFSSYLTIIANMAIKYWRLMQPYSPIFKDKAPHFVALLTSLFMIGYPVSQMIDSKIIFVPVLSVFGVILLYVSILNIYWFGRPEYFLPKQPRWLLLHIGTVCGSYIAAFTAFLLNNFEVNPGWILWLLPTVIGAPIITITSIKWGKRLHSSGANTQPQVVANI